MLSDNIRNYRKKNNLSQDELAEKVGVSRQSVSFWENGQTQPTIENIISLAKIFQISTDALLTDCESSDVFPQPAAGGKAPVAPAPKKNTNTGLAIFLIILFVILVLCIVAIAMALKDLPGSDNEAGTVATTPNTQGTTSNSQSEPFDLFTFCKNYALSKGQVSGNCVMYQQPSAKYGGYQNEYFSISYWADSDLVEFCLYCPLSDEQSHSFYLRMRGGYNGTYEYVSSKYYRDTFETFRYASGTIDPAVFSATYPINCYVYEAYENSADGQNDFMEQTRVGICDLIRCLKQFVTVENMGCDFSVFGFVNF